MQLSVIAALGAILIRSALFFVAVFMTGAAACAAELPLGWGFGPADLPVRDLDLKAGIIVGPGPASLLQFGAPDCPTGTGCPDQPIRRPYLVSGNLVAVTETIPGYVYVTYPTPKRLYEGWLPSYRVNLPSNGIATPLSAWVGKWHGNIFDNQEFDVTVTNGMVHVGGSAVNFNNYNEGDVEGIAVPNGNFLFVSDIEYDKCVVKMVVLNGVLAVEDAPACDGPNVTLSGIYKRNALSPRRPRKRHHRKLHGAV